jgi:hypothetical protein
MGKIALFFIICFSSFSQTHLNGVLKDSQNNPIASASVILKDASEQTVAYIYSNENGTYQISLKKTGTFSLNILAIGFEKQAIEIEINENTPKEIINNFILIEKINEIKEIIIQSNLPIIVKKDTVIFDPKAFMTGNEQTVEDMLKKIPGLNIDSNGTIKIGEQEIEKVMVDGDDMFEKGYKILTKNMPVNPINKVELYQNYSNNKHLKGIEKSKKVALNLTLKDNYKRIWFGNTSLGYGVV